MSNLAAVQSIYEAFGKGDVTDLPTLSGGHYRDEEIHLWTFNDAGKITRLRHYTDTAKHIAAFGG